MSTDTPIAEMPADHFDPPTPTVPRFGWVGPKNDTKEN